MSQPKRDGLGCQSKSRRGLLQIWKPLCNSRQGAEDDLQVHLGKSREVGQMIGHLE